MKTKFFKNGLCAKLALAAVALTTAMFTSCTNEDIAIDVTPVNAKAYISPVVVANGVDVTSSAVLTFSQQPINGGGSYYFEGNPGLGAMTVTVSASYQGMNGSTVVSIPAVTAGSSFAVVAKIFVSYAPESLTPNLVAVTETVDIVNETEIVTFENTSDATITKEFTYIDIEGTKIIENDYTGVDEGVWSWINAHNLPYTETKKTITIQIPPYSIVVPEVKTKKTVATYTLDWVTRATTTLATLVIEEYTTTVSTPSVDISHGGGHDHGNGTNAGGGIVNND